MTDLSRLTTESANDSSTEIDRLSAIEIARLMNAEDAQVPAAVGEQVEPIAEAIDKIAAQLRIGGRLVYIGAGTSGRLGVLDASECPPTFSTPPELVVGLIAGGGEALTRAIEGAEDRPADGEADLREIQLRAADVVVGIATSGRTPYVLGGLRYAGSIGAYTVGVTCNDDSELRAVVDLLIAPIVGPEVITGSTRLKAGTATKLVLNTLTTGAMVRIGKTFGNVMVDLKASNSKLVDRSRRIVAKLAEVDEATAWRTIVDCGGEVKTAIVAARGDVSPERARELLATADGHLRQVLDSLATDQS
ncbi:MAG: N-acetylmuramic acid 6-phosphate etherase [Pirellulaceae bacterium]|jgi:N-acetylmuramic acid 6-phosphate etherase|nr:N-acetylmuramic acid 6-phosphate etherase [Pirellulaceae bacterium]MDP7019900.1 N-acetylmuramic acid 6-phosphate etherase [Pirellulaceae bacterium]